MDSSTPRPFLHADCLGKRVFAVVHRAGHESKQRSPIYRSAPRQVTGVSIKKTQFIGRDENEPGFVQTATPRPAKHLENLIRFE